MMPPPKVYLAGPDVFHRDAIEIGRRKKELCRDYGMIGLYPFDNEITGADVSSEIYAANVAMIHDADCAIVNLTPFRSPSADVGTVFELGMLIALGKDVFAYSNTVGSLLDRAREDARHRVHHNAEADEWRDGDDMLVENFRNADNLMIDASLKAIGRTIHRCDVPPHERFTDLDGFIACLVEAKAVFEKTRASEPYAA